MKVRADVVIGLLGLAFLLLDMLVMAGVAIQQPAVKAQARLESPLTQTYIVSGRYLVRWVPGMDSVARALADAAFSDAYPAVDANPQIALDTLFEHAHGALAPVAKATYWLAFPLLLLWLFLRWRRPKPVHLIGGDR